MDERSIRRILMARAAEERMTRPPNQSMLNERRRNAEQAARTAVRAANAAAARTARAAAESKAKWERHKVMAASARQAEQIRLERFARLMRKRENEQRRQQANNRAQTVLKAANAYRKLLKLKKLINETNGWNKPARNGPLFGPKNYPKKRNTKLKKN